MAVDFSVVIDGFLHVLTTENALLAETQTFFTLEVFNADPMGNGELILQLSSFDLQNNYNPLHLLIGPNDKDDLLISQQPLAADSILNFDVPYYLFIGVDSESFGVVPEPPMLALISLGVGILVVYTRKNRKTLRAS